MAIIPHYKQETNYTCGPACMRMALASFGIVKSEKWLAGKMRTSKKNGTPYASFPGVARRLGLDFVQEEKSSLATVTGLIRKGFVVIVCILCKDDKSGHYAILARRSEKKVFLLDPWAGDVHPCPMPCFFKSWTAGGTVSPKPRWLFAVKKAAGALGAQA
jgi:ABC-type bacteriocin/lantibiotic exporter with double-glycine peptidase domain